MGGENAARGKNIVIFPDGRMINLGAKTSLSVDKGTIIRIISPGGGGYGKPE